MKSLFWCLRYVSSIIIAFLVLGLAVNAESGERPVFGLPQLIRMALEKSPEIAETQSEIAGAKGELAQAEAALYPQIETTALAGPVNNTRRPMVSGSRIIDPSPDFGIGVFGRLDIIMTQPLYTFGKISNRVDAAAKGVMVKESRLSQKRNEIALRVKELYYGLVLARAGVDAARDAAGYFDEARRRMERLLKLGSPNVLESDLYRLDAYRANILRSQAAAEEGMKIAYFALKSMIGLPIETDYEPADRMITVSDERLGELNDYIRKASSDRPEFKQLDQAIKAQKFNLEAAISDMYPSFFMVLGGSFAGAPGRETFHNPYIRDEFNHAAAGIAGGLKWQFDFGILKGKVEKEKADYEKLLHTKATAELGIPIEVAQRYHEVKEWRAAVDAYDKAVASSRKWIIAAFTNFDMGVGTADDLLRSIVRYGENHGKYLGALFNYNISFARLEYATGVQSW